MAAVDASPTTAHTDLIAPHGGSLVDLMVPEADRESVKASAGRRIECSHRNACDVELLVVGGFSPLRGFMHQEDYDAVVAGHRTSSGLLFGLPIVFDSDDESIAIGDRLLLTYQGQELAVLTVESLW
ncbi:MAG: sulfate adenylyltransferase, partial [Prochlorococcaceae cyanobacterium]